MIEIKELTFKYSGSKKNALENVSLTIEKGDFVGLSTEEVGGVFGALTSNRNEMILWMVIVCVIGTVVCSLGLEKGVEKITKPMMLSLFFIMIILVVRAITLPGAMEGLEFYLKPDFSKIKDAFEKMKIFRVKEWKMCDMLHAFVRLLL